jgi:hypothetical protein
MSKIERNSHKGKKVLQSEIDFSKPVDITLFGSEDDPCFGKHHDPKDSNCKICGDSELCQLIKGQKNNLIRNKVESKQAFKDTQSIEHPEFNLINAKKFIRAKFKKEYDRKKTMRLTKKKFTPYLKDLEIEMLIDKIYGK